MAPTFRWLCAALLLSSCTRVNDDFCDVARPCDGDRVCDLAGVLGTRNACVAPVCEPDQVISCSASRAEICTSDQLGTVTDECEFGCTPAEGCAPCPPGGVACRELDSGESEVAACDTDGSVLDRRDCVLGCADAERCTDIVPSNSLDMDLGFIDANLGDLLDLELGDGFRVNSDGTITDGAGQTVTAPSSRTRVPGLGPTMRVFRVRSLTITGEVTLAGSEVIAFVANSDITIDGLLVVRAGAATDIANDCVGDPGISNGQDASGSGGGGFESSGGEGGDVDGAVNGGNGGQSFGNSSLVPLFGGCAGGGTMGGAGGGGLQLVSRTRIVFGPAGGINAGGLGGSSPVSASIPPAGGGGSGGAILLEAPVIDVAESAFVAANGGGGACTGPSIVEPGQDGGLGPEPAAGGDCLNAANYGRGGNGGSKLENRDPGDTVFNSGVPDSGGGGGGSVGVIRVNAVLGTPSSSRFSPDPSTGMLDTF